MLSRAIEILYKNPACLGGLYTTPIKVGLVLGSKRSKKMCSMSDLMSILLNDILPNVADYPSPLSISI